MKDLKEYIDGRVINGHVSLEDCLSAIERAYNDGAKSKCLIENKLGEDVLIAEFDRFRKSYLGTKRGLETEYKNMKKKHKDYATIIPKLYDIYSIFSIRREAMKNRGDWLPMLPNLQTFINQRRWEELECDAPLTIDNEKHYSDINMGVGVYVMNGKKYYGNGIEIPMNAPKRPSSQYVYNPLSNTWYIL